MPPNEGTTKDNTMYPTYLSIYKIAGQDRSAADLTLYEACKALLSLATQSGEDHEGCMIDPPQVDDYTHIRCKGRCVAFWSAWSQEVKPMFGANETERELILTWLFSS